jgi:glycosyltransferase involved in cell wall biosynthesis
MTTVALDLTPLRAGSRFRGIGRYITELARAVAAATSGNRAGFRVTGLVRDLPWDRGPWFDPSLRFDGGTTSVPGPQAFRIRHIARRLTLYRRLRREEHALLHATEPSGYAPPRGFPFVVTCHDLIPIVLADLYRVATPFSEIRRVLYARRWYGRARRVVAISEATKRDLVERIGIDASRIDVVPLGVDHERFRPRSLPDDAARARAAAGTARPFLLYVGAGDARKNLPFLVEAFARSGAARDADLVVAGAVHEKECAALVATARRTGVAAALRLPGFVPDESLPALYRTCLAHVFPSLYEGFGLPVAEALACGAPTATSFRSSLREVAGDAALELPVTDLDGAAAAIRRLVDDAALREDLRRRGPPQVAAFTWDACALGVLATWRRALAS